MPQRVGSQIQVAAANTGDGIYYMQHPKIVGLQDGGFIAVWQQFHETNSPFDSTSIQAQIYNADGSERGARFQVDTFLYDYGDTDVSNPSVTVLKSGKVLVAWEQKLHTLAASDDNSEIRVREIDPTATTLSQMLSPVTRATVSRQYDGLSEYRPNLSATEDGGYVLEFSSSSGGRYVNFPDWIGSFPAGLGGDVAGLVGGGTVRAELTYDQAPDTASFGIKVTVDYTHGSGYSRTIASRTINVPTSFAGNQENPSIAALSDGRFVVVWQDNNSAGGDGSGSCIKARIFKLDKSKLNDPMANPKIDIIPDSGEIIVNTKTAGAQMMPVVEALPGGGFAVAFQDWASSTDPYAMDIRVAAFNSTGGRLGDDMLVAANMDGRQINPAITTLKDGRFVVSWQDGGGGRIKAQIFGTGTTNPDTNPDNNPAPTTIPGSAGNDTLDGTKSEGLFDGGNGFDTVTYASSGGHVVVFINPAASGFNQGHARSDQFTSIESFIGTDFNDEFSGHTGNERINGGKGNDRIHGEGGDDYLIGGEENDTLFGGAGRDTLDGGSGDNTYDRDSADTHITSSGKGKQTVQAHVSYALSKSVKIDVLKAATGARSISLTGNTFNDDIIGNAGKNTLKGQSGNDKLSGGKGKDVLIGGKGKDTFVFDTKASKTNRDTISDFSTKDDSIWLDNAVFTKLGMKGSVTKPAQLKKNFFVVGDKAEDANDYIVYNKASGTLSYDADGSRSGTAVEIATLKPGLALTYKDFFVI